MKIVYSNGKELFTDNGLDWLGYGARFYDATTARWWVQDPKAEKYYALTPYNYVAGNQVGLVDPDGMDTFKINIETQNMERIAVQSSTSHTHPLKVKFRDIGIMDIYKINSYVVNSLFLVNNYTTVIRTSPGG